MVDKQPYILVLTGWYPSYLEPLNGDFVRDQVALLRRSGQRVDIVYADLNIAYIKQGQLIKRYYQHVDVAGNHTSILYGPTWPKNTSRGFRYYINQYTDIVIAHIAKYGTPDVIHAHTYLGAIVASQVKKTKSIPYVISEHYTGWMTGDMREAHISLAKAAFNAADKCLAVSQALADSIKNKIDVKTNVLPNYIDDNLFYPKERNISDPIRIVGIGDLIPRKQWDHLIEAVAMMKNKYGTVSLKIAGDGGQRKQLKSLVENLGISEDVELVGMLTKQRIADLLRSSDILVQCSHTETFGITAIEALASGLEVITYNNGGSQAYADLPGVHLMDDGNINSLAQRIRDVIKQFDPSPNRKKIISEHCKSKFGASAVIPQLMNIYKEVVID